MLIGPIQVAAGWTGVWYFLVLCVITGTLLMGPKIMSELSEAKDTEDYTTVNTTEPKESKA